MTSFLSVGIDVGTTSTHLTFSLLTIVNAALVNQSPLPKIEKREIVYQSEVHLTPLIGDGNIDAAAVFKLIEKEYEIAAINREDINVGAAIITGETALKRNAREVIEKLSFLSGELVAVSAGPHFEALLSARGSGAAEASRLEHKTILNMDIGGGTMNLALYKNGALVSTHCLGIGGRCVQVKPVAELSGGDGKNFFDVIAASESGKVYLQDWLTLPDPPSSGACEIGSCNLPRLSIDDLDRLAESIASDVVSFIKRESQATIMHKLPLSSFENAWAPPDEIWLCGGVAEFSLNPDLHRFKFFDLGGLLADALIDRFESASLNFKIPAQPIRATVTGAGMFSMQVSGSTIDFDIDSLPLRNVPLVRPFQDCELLLDGRKIEAAIMSAITRVDPERRLATIAFELPALDTANDYSSLKKIATGLAGAACKFNHLTPFVLIVREDLGMALGQLLRQSFQNDRNETSRPIVVLDGVMTNDGDFLDIGRPVSLDANGIARTLPVVLKTLVFGRE